MQRNLEEWVHKSSKIPRIAEMHTILYNFQALGRMDIELTARWEEVKNSFSRPENIQKVDQISFLSSLWVMASYEVLRIIKKFDPRQQTIDVYELFRRVRVPMVKFEAPKNNKVPVYPNDFGIALAAIGGNPNNFGWAVSSNVFISRDQLAQALYDLY